MSSPNKNESSLSLSLRLRVAGREPIALGPGKVELLKLIETTGSLTAAAKEMGLSYMKAWSLIQTMKPLVETSRGGRTGGGVTLTAKGRQALALYQTMQHEALAASKKSWQQLQRLLGD